MDKPKTTMKIRKNLFVFLGILAIHFSVSCVDDADNSVSFREECMTLHIQVPGLQAMSTYTLDAFDECQIETMDVLAFNSDDNTFLYRVEGSNISVPNSNNPNSQTVDVRLEKGGTSNKIYLLLIANARDQVSAALTDGVIAAGKSRDDIMNKIEFSCPDKWPVKPGKFTRFPMWGQSGVINLSGPTSVGTITLVRSVAKIDVGLNYNESTSSFSGLGSTFKLESITLYNSSNSLQVCPGVSALKPSNDGVIAPSVPSSAQSNSPIEYLVNGQNDNPDKISFTNRIYLAEAAKNTVCLIIGGYYTPPSGTGGLMYYRVDLLEPIAGAAGDPVGNSYLPVLRNYLYRINITGVNGSGFNSKEAALSAPSSNLTVQITSSDLSTDMAYNQYYMLGLDRNRFLFDNGIQNGTINVNTTYDKGWTAKTSDSWIVLNQTSGSMSDKTLTFNLSANTGADSRTGTVTVSAGQETTGILTRTVTIEQQAIPSLSISGVESAYQLSSSNNYSFTVKSVYDWQARVKEDPSGILRTFTTSGSASPAGGAFQFTLRNDPSFTILNANAIVTFYSLSGAFDPVDVTIKGISAFDLGGVYVFLNDLHIGKDWYGYRDACAALPSVMEKPWRLPTDTELSNVYSDTGGGINVTIYNFTHNTWYWSSSPSGTSYYLRKFGVGLLRGSSTPTATGFCCRCVRDK